MVKINIQIDMETENSDELKNELRKMILELINPELLDVKSDSEDVSRKKEGIDETLYSVHIVNLGFRTRDRNALVRSGILNFGDVLKMNADEILKCRGIGVIIFYELVERLKMWGEKNDNSSVIEWANREYDYYEKYLKRQGDDEKIRYSWFYWHKDKIVLP